MELNYDCQKTANELNATLEGGTCMLVETERYTNSRETIHMNGPRGRR